VEVLGRDLFCGERVCFFDGGCAGPGGGSFATASERSEHRWVWVGGEQGSPGGDKDHERRKF